MAEAWSAARAAAPAELPAALETRGLSVWAGRRPLLREVGVRFPRGRVTCVTGPSGAGKSTLLRSLNRLVELAPGLRVSGQVYFEGAPLYGRGVDPDLVRARVGMLFQRPVVFPGSIRDNVLFAVRRLRRIPRRQWAERTEAVLVEVALWGEVRARLDEPAASLSVGQQQRLCLARSLILEPEVMLLDEPTSALDAASGEAIEALVRERRGRQTFVVVTHDLAQARRLGDVALCVSLREGCGEVTRCHEAHPQLRDPECRSVMTGSESP